MLNIYFGVCPLMPFCNEPLNSPPCNQGICKPVSEATSLFFSFCLNMQWIWLLINTVLESNSFRWHPAIKTNKKSKVADAVAVQACPRGFCLPRCARPVTLTEGFLWQGPAWQQVRCERMWSSKRKKKQLIILPPQQHIADLLVYFYMLVYLKLKGPHCPYFVCAFQIQLVRISCLLFLQMEIL